MPWMLLGTPAMAAASPTKTGTPADVAWSPLQAMAGEGDEAATDGRTIPYCGLVIAARSAIMLESRFEGHMGVMRLTT